MGKKPRTRRDRRRLTAIRYTAVNANDPTLGGQIQMVLINLVKPAPGTPDPTPKLDVLLKATEGRKEFFLKTTLGVFMGMRTSVLGRDVPSEECFTFAKERVADRIAVVWKRKIDPKKLEGGQVEWEELADLTLGYDPEKLPKVRGRITKKSLDIVEEVKDAPESIQDTAQDNEPGEEEIDVSALENMFAQGEFDEYD